MNLLNKPILPDEIEWKIQSYTKDKSKTIIVPYITARCVMERFDVEFGMNWKSEFREVESGFICKLSVLTADVKEWISREDGASRTGIEPVKGGISDSLKRAAHQFGLGRCLYDYPRIFINGEQKYISSKILTRLDNMVIQINDKSFTDKVVTL
jgi:hypothetical protein